MTMNKLIPSFAFRMQVADLIFKQPIPLPQSSFRGDANGSAPTGRADARPMTGAARPDDRLRIEPGISRFPDAQLRI